MNRPKSRDRLNSIVAALENFPAGATFIDVAASLEPVPPMRTVQRWLSAVVRQKRVIRVGKGPSTRYKLPEPVRRPTPAFGSPVGRALHEIVTQPLAERAPADYRRVALDRYVANETYYLPADIRARIASTRDAAGWRQSPNLERTVLDLVSRCLSLEDAMSAAAPVAGVLGGGGLREAALPGVLMPRGVGAARPASVGGAGIGALTEADLAGWLTQPERPAVRADVQFAWNIRAVLTGWSARAPAASVTPALLQQMFDRAISRVNVGGALGVHRLLSPHAPNRPTLSFLRASSLALPATVYEPPADGWVIKACFDQVLRVSNAIADPIERAFFLLTHLLYLLPFDQCNATMALLTMNVPLVAAGLRPMTFAGVQPGDLLVGIRAVWELNRTELLRDAFIAAA